MTQQNRSGQAPRQGERQGDDARQPSVNEQISKDQSAQARMKKLFDLIRQRRAEIEAVLPADVPYLKFEAVVNMAIRREPRLLDTYGPSFIKACIQAAYDGLLPDGNQAVILYSNNKVPGTGRDGKKALYRLEARYQSMVYGLRLKIVQSGAATFVDAKVVFSKEHFVHQEGLEPILEHTPILDADARGDPVATYAIARLTGGDKVFDVLSMADVMAAREVAMTKNVWDGPFKFEMWKKTAIRRLSKAIPTVTAIRDAEALEMFQQFGGQQPALLPPPRPDRRDFAGQLEHQVEVPLDLGSFDGGYDTAESITVTTEGEEEGDKPKPAKRQAKAGDRKSKPAESSGEPATDDKGAAPAPAAEKPRFALPDPAPSDHDGWSNYYQGLRGEIEQLGDLGTVDDLNRERRLHQPVLEQAPDDLRTAIADAFQDAITGLA